MPRSSRLLAGLLLAVVLNACGRSEPAGSTTTAEEPTPAPRLMRCAPAPGAQDFAAQPAADCDGARS